MTVEAAVAAVVFIGGALVAVALWQRSWQPDRAAALAMLRDDAADMIRLPGRLRRVATDPRTPRRARWLLVALAVYVASPIDPIPDFIPGLGHLDELLVVPVALARIRRMIPAEVWAEHFPPRGPSGTARPNPLDVPEP